MSVTITTRVNESLIELIDRIAAEEGMDRSTVLRRFIEKSAKKWLVKKSLIEYQDGKLTLRQAAKFSGITIWQLIEAARSKKVYFPYNDDDLKDDLRAING